MEEKDKEIDEQTSENPTEAGEQTERADEESGRVHYTSGQKAFYTVISVALFCVLYFGGKGIIGMINRPYNIYLTPENISGENISRFFNIGGVSAEYGLALEGAGLYNYIEGYEMYALFSGFEDEEWFAENAIDFEYGDPYEDVRIEFFPYADSPAYPEYAFGTQYVDINDPNRLISVFEFDGNFYAEYTEYGGIVSSELRAAFSEGEKVYGS